MNTVVRNRLSSIEFAEPQQVSNLAVVPIVARDVTGPQYLTMPQAMAQGLLVVTEIDKGGSVPDLKVTSLSDLPVLLLDGEELVGAKQNRVLNTTILLKEKQETFVPVSLMA